MILRQYRDTRIPSTVRRVSSFPLTLQVPPTCNRDSSIHLPRPRPSHSPRDPGRLPRARTTCLSIFSVALLRVIKVSPFSFSFLSPFPFSTYSFPFFHCLSSLSPSISLLFSLLLSLTVFLLNDGPFTAVSDDVAGARRFPRENWDSLDFALTSLHFEFSLSLSFSIIGFSCHRYRLR